MSMIRDAFTWVDTGAIAYPQLHAKILELTMPALVVKNLFPEFPLVQGKTASFVKQKGSRSAAIGEVAEGAEMPLDFTPYDYATVTPYKKALRERITRENIEDLYIPVIEDQLRRLARRMAYTIDSDCLTVIANSAGFSIAATGKTMGATGTEITIANTVGSKDVLAAEAKIKSANFIPDGLLMNPINTRDLKYLPTFTLYSQYGDPVVQNGAMGKVYGYDIYESNVVPAGTAYMVSTGKNLSASYAPMGYFVIKRPLASDTELKKEFDSVDVLLSTRYAPVVLNGECICAITGLSTS